MQGALDLPGHDGLRHDYQYSRVASHIRVMFVTKG